MIDLSWCLNFSYHTSALLLGAVGLLLIGSTSDLEQRQRRFYNATMLLLMLLSLLKLVWMLVGLYEGSVVVQAVADALGEALNLLLFPVLTAWLLYLCGEPLRGNPTLRTVCAIQAAKLVIALAEAGFIVPSGETAQPLVTADLLLGIALLAVNLVILVRRWGKLEGSQRLFFVVCDVLPTAWMILYMELFLMRDQNRRYLMQKEEVIRQRDEIIRQKEELVRRETQVAVLQMRPHFIYNTLMSIYYLCRQDADKAQQVILDFSRYLKKNFTAIVSEDTVPFSEELEHTQAYLAVEKVRFEDKLFVEFDTSVTVFRLPPLTLQPIVENAVKHGVSPGLDPLYLSVLTRETETGCEIIVEDTGPGFAPSDDKEPHIALANIRERLKTMCAGTLEIASREAGGTRVTILIPMKR